MSSVATGPTGTLTQKMSRQPIEVTRSPPTTGPRSRLIPSPRPKRRSPAPRSRGSVKVVVMFDIAMGVSIEPPIPCNMRRATSIVRLGARLQSQGPTEKQTMPIVSTLPRPIRPGWNRTT